MERGHREYVTHGQRRGGGLTVGANDGGTSRNAHHTVNKDPATRAECFLDKVTRVGKVDQDILIFRVLDGNNHIIGLRIERMFYAD